MTDQNACDHAQISHQGWEQIVQDGLSYWHTCLQQDCKITCVKEEDEAGEWERKKHSKAMWWNQNAAQVFYMNVSLKGTYCLHNSFDGIFILSDNVAFMSGAALITAIAEETASSTALKVPPAGRESVCIFNKPVSSYMFLLLSFFCFLQQLRARFISWLKHICFNL